MLIITFTSTVLYVSLGNWRRILLLKKRICTHWDEVPFLPLKKISEMECYNHSHTDQCRLLPLPLPHDKILVKYTCRLYPAVLLCHHVVYSIVLHSMVDPYIEIKETYNLWHVNTILSTYETSIDTQQPGYLHSSNMTRVNHACSLPTAFLHKASFNMQILL